jgi:hypothetical protein
VLASVTQPGAAGAEIKLPAGAVIMKYDSGFSQFYQRFEEILQKKVMIAEKCKNIPIY